MDGAVLFGLLPRRVSFLVKAEAVQGPLGWLLTNVGQYALDARRARTENRCCRRWPSCKAGGAIGIFPEGTRGDGNVDAVYRGRRRGWPRAVGATVVPVAMRGTARPTGRRRTAVPAVGRTCWSASRSRCSGAAARKAVAAATEAIRVQLAALVVPARHRRSRTGRRISCSDDYEPARSW